MNLRDDLKAYLDGELPAERMAEMREAIDRDPLLAQEVEELGRISQTLRVAAMQPSAVGLEETLRALEKSERRERKPWWPWLVPIAGMACTLIFVVAPTMDQAKMAAKSDSSVAFSHAKESMSTASPSVDSDFVAAKEKMVRDLANGSAAPGEPADLSRMRSGVVKKAPSVVKSSPDASTMRYSSEGGLNRGRNGVVERRGLSAPRGAVPTVVSPEGASVTNARVGQTKGQGTTKTGDLSDTKNFAVLEPERKEGEEKASDLIVGVRGKENVVVETLVVEVDSLAEADEAVRGLVDRLGAVASPTSKLKAEADAVGTFDASRDHLATERRVTLEIDGDRLAETKKQVSETVKETQTRREGAQNRVRGEFFGGGGGGLGGAQQSEAQGAGRQQQGPPLQTQGGNQQATGQQSTGQFGGRSQGRGSGVPGAPAPVGQKVDSTAKRAAASKSQSLKPRKRIEIILRVKAKPAGKLEE